MSSDQVITCPKKVQQTRLFILQRFDEKGVTMSELCKLKNERYNIWYPRIFGRESVNLDYINSMLSLLNYNYKLVLIKNNLHKVYQSSMNF